MYVALLLWGMLLGSQHREPLDPCELKLPASLRAEFAKRYVGYRQIRVSDYEAEEIRRERQHHGGNPCVAAEGGDFDGDGKRDFVFLAARPGERLVALVALKRGTSWLLQELWDLGIEPTSTYLGGCYAEVLPPGRYENVYGTTPVPAEQLEPNERLEYQGNSDVPVVGEIASSGIAFFLERGKWLHVWIAD